MGAAWFGWRVSWLLFSHTVDCGALVAQRDRPFMTKANLKHGRQAKDKLLAQRHAAKVGRRVRGELKRIERQIVDAGLMLD